ncbi:ABC transporter permease [Verticiella sediminum]|uniref:ABC transporter permease n=1 Tax=Verticiella sediminum TaxID=1247510 RepID=A0A556ACY2_9BURK|nr:ABC transporter permease [Verticiella sediminum]TSH90723.1 ABC transporter permease [Verticiella sediminum]
MSGGAQRARSTRRYLFKRFVQVLPTALLIVLFSFLLLKAAPGDMVDVMAGESGGATAEYMQEMRELYGLDVPMHRQFLIFLGNISRLDLGYSFRDNMPVAELIWSALPATLLLSLTAILFAVTVGVVLGALSAKYRGTPLDTGITVFSSIGFATPLFWVGLMLIVTFGVKLRWFPVAGLTTVGLQHASAWAYVKDVAAHLVLPAFSLGCYYLALYVRLTRSAMLEIFDLDFVRTARAKGLSEWRVLVRHVLRNALLPIVTITGLQLGSLFSGTVVIETVFGWPGIGRMAYDAVAARDLNVFLAIFLCSSLLVIVMNLVVDLLYAVLDPRIEVTA